MTEVPLPADGTERLDQRQLLTLLGIWAAAALIPGIVTINQPVMLAYAFWGIGFLAALVLFMKIAEVTRTTELWPWLVASVLPWVVDVAIPHSLFWIPVFIVAAGAFGWWIFRRSSATDRLMHEGIAGTGTVIEVLDPKFANMAVNNGFLRRSVRVSVARPDKAMAYEAVVRDLFREDELPQPGDTIDLVVDLEDAMHIMRAPSDDVHVEEAPVDASPAEDEPDGGQPDAVEAPDGDVGQGD